MSPNISLIRAPTREDIEMKLTERITSVQPSPTLAITAKANEMKAQGIDIISFGAGEPDFNTPESICDAAKRALDEGHTTYTNVSGVSPLREAIAREVCEERKRGK